MAALRVAAVGAVFNRAAMPGGHHQPAVAGTVIWTSLAGPTYITELFGTLFFQLVVPPPRLVLPEWLPPPASWRSRHLLGPTQNVFKR